MQKQKSTIWIRLFFFSLRGFRDRVRECHPDDENQDLKSVLDSRELRKSRPVTYFMFHFKWKGSSMPEKSVLRTSQGNLGAVFCKSCLFTSGFASCYKGGLKWCSKTKILRHFNDLRVPSPLKKNRFCTCSEVHAGLSSHGPHALLFIHRYNDAQWCQEWLSETCKFIPCSAFHEIFSASSQNTIAHLFLQITIIIPISRTQVYSGKPDLQLKT